MPRFVLLRHQCPAGYGKPDHWDFMLERPEGLWTWELRELPRLWRTALRDGMPDSVERVAESVPANRLADHRRAYLDYEGAVSHNRGSVSCCDRGTYRLLRETNDRLEIQLDGNHLQGKIALTQEDAKGNLWQLRV